VKQISNIDQISKIISIRMRLQLFISTLLYNIETKSSINNAQTCNRNHVDIRTLTINDANKITRQYTKS